MIRSIRLDHVAVATEDMGDAWPRYAGDLAGRWLGGGDNPGFSSAQVGYANGMKVEVLQPHTLPENDFLRRFLDTHGPGTHHLTYKVDDLDQALDAVAEAGLSPVGVDRRFAEWQEAFLHPKEARGVVVQLAQSSGGDWTSPPPAGLAPPRTPAPARLDHVAHAVASLDDGRALFATLLGGEEVGSSGGDEGARWVDLAWPGGGRVRLVAPTDASSPLAVHLAGRPGRIHHLAFTTEDPAAVPGARPLADGTYEIPPEANLGVRLVLRPGDDRRG